MFDAAFLRVQHKIHHHHHHHCLLYQKKCSGISAAHKNVPQRENPTSHKITKSGNKFQLLLPHHIRCPPSHTSKQTKKAKKTKT
jgi:hypothetical protein